MLEKLQNMKFLGSDKMLTPETVIQRKPGLLFNEIDGEIVMLSIENSEYYGLDKTGSRIWELIEKPLTMKELVAKLMDEFDVDEERCWKETSDFIFKLELKKLLM